VIGREKDPANSEVWRLIQDSIAQDRRRAEAAREREMLLRSQVQQLAHDDDEQNEQISDAEQQPTLATDDSRVVRGLLLSVHFFMG